MDHSSLGDWIASSGDAGCIGVENHKSAVRRHTMQRDLRDPIITIAFGCHVLLIAVFYGLYVLDSQYGCVKSFTRDVQYIYHGTVSFYL